MGGKEFIAETDPSILFLGHTGTRQCYLPLDRLKTSKIGTEYRIHGLTN